MGIRWIKMTFLIFVSLVIIIPVSLVFLASLKSTSDFYANPLGLGGDLSFGNFISLFQQSMGVYLLNSVYVTVLTVFLVLLFATMIAYTIIRVSGKFGWLIYGLFIIGMMVPAQVIMISQYSIVRNLNLMNSLNGLVVVSVSVLLPIAVFILTGFMKGISKEIIEASSIDGVKEWTIYSRILLPLALPSVSATAIFLFVMVWNDLLYPLLFITEDSKKTLPLALLQFQGEYVTDMPMIFAGVTVASLPMIVAYIFMQRYFIAGITAGSVKG